MARYARRRTLEDDSYGEIRQALAAPYRSWSAEDIDSFLAAQGIAAEDLESFLSGLKSVGSVVASALPTVGSIVGTAFGGPIGTMVGGAAGQLAGQALGQVTAPSAPSRRPGGGAPARRRPSAGGIVSAVAGSPAAGQLMQLLARPETQKALLSMLLGPAGRSNVPVGGASVPVGAFANAVSTLGAAAAQEYSESVALASEGMPSYLANYAGEAAVDLADPEARAARLLELLADNEPESDESDESDEAEPEDDYARSYRRRMQSAQRIDAYYDAIEQAEMAMAGDW